MAMSEQFTKVGDGLLVRAPGKINISLLVKGKRPDGYHEIETIMAKVDWYDEIVIEKYEIRNTKYETQNPKSEIPNTEQGTQNAEQKTEDPALQSFAEASEGQNIEPAYGGQASNIEHPTSNSERRTDEKPVIELICKGEYKVPEGEENLVYKAAKMILETGHQGIRESGNQEKLPTSNIEHPISNAEQRTEGIEESGEQENKLRITLTKNVPAGAGLGSGSSDAAATLMGINKFLKLGLSKSEINRLAAELGSDVAFFLDGPVALCTGRGEKVKKIQGCEFRALLVVPDVSVSTKRVYENYRDDEAKYRRLSEEIKIYIEKKRVDLVSRMCANMLQESSFELHPELGVLKKKIESLGIRPVSLSGSGSSMFCIIDGSNEEGVMAYQKKLADNSIRSIIVKNNMW